MHNLWHEQKSAELIEQSIAMRPSRIKTIRAIYKLTQVGFADLLNVSYHTYKNWEIGHRIPCTSAVSLLTLAEKDPKIFLKKRYKLHKNINKK